MRPLCWMQAGNESVLRARFEDAQFFFQEDLKRPLSDFRPQLSGITFHKSLGTMLDKSVRIVWAHLAWLFCIRHDMSSASQPQTVLASHLACCTRAPAAGCMTLCACL
jgi:glycyl-tRNA synthetase beta subunit